MNTKDAKRTKSTARSTRPRRKPDNRPSKSPEMQVQYTPAKTFNRKRFLLQLATVAAVVLALVLGMSIFFKVGQVNVAGTQKYTPWDIREASGIQDGESLLGLSEAKISANIRAKLPYVGSVRVGIKLPDTVNIEVTELEVVYAVEAVDATWWLLDATGRVVDITDAAAAKNHTRILGVRIHNAQIGEPAKAAEPKSEDPTQTDPAIPTMPPVPAEESLRIVIQVLTALENNGVMGVIETVDVSDITSIVLWYEDRYEVKLGDNSQLDRKVALMKAAVVQEGQYKSGRMDVSFEIFPNEAYIERFENNSSVKN